MAGDVSVAVLDRDPGARAGLADHLGAVPGIAVVGVASDVEEGAPGLREVTRTAPYMHNGVFATLEAVIDFYDRVGGVPRVPDPVTNRYRFKLGKGRVVKLGESPYKRSVTSMSFAPRNIIRGGGVATRKLFGRGVRPG